MCCIHKLFGDTLQYFNTHCISVPISLTSAFFSYAFLPTADVTITAPLPNECSNMMFNRIGYYYCILYVRSLGDCIVYNRFAIMIINEVKMVMMPTFDRL